MLPADCSHRLLSILSCALEECVEQKRLLEHQLRHCRRLLETWKHPVPDGMQQDVSTAIEQATEKMPSAEEQQELVLLNRALEKAMRIRNTVCTPVPGVQRKEDWEPDRKPPSVSNAPKCPAKVPKEKSPKTALGTSTTKPNPIKKPPGYTLRPPYRTNPERRRSRGALSAVLHSSSSAQGDGKGQTREVSQQKVLSSTGRTDQQQNEAPGLHTRESLLHCRPVEPLTADSKVDVTGHMDQVSSESQMMSAAQAKSFTPKELGHTLKLPPPFRQALTKNERLWEKVCECYPHPVSETHFIEKMENNFGLVHSSFSPAVVEAEAMIIRNALVLLNQQLAAERSLESSAPLTLEKEYQWLLTLEALQASASKYLSRLQELREGVTLHVWHGPGNAASITSSEQVDWFILGKGSHSGNESLFRKHLVYSSLKELKEMEAEKKRLCHLQQQLHIQKVLMAELIPLLESRSLQGPSLALPYRSIYSQLCEGGQKFPALVFDDLPD
ncbi:tubulin epsilon and delta complex protein 2 isoform X2 [Ambystoma mexicanum]|uniref:tubulin epsilon and delta complex protein 2 isoform X2 n=1 Tax=Ambystoma mexicanum TaxID=8296 RepID=UPI0037E86281